MLTIADGGGVQEPQILADVICEQPLMETVSLYFLFINTRHHVLISVKRCGVLRTVFVVLIFHCLCSLAEGCVHQRTAHWVNRVESKVSSFIISGGLT